MTRAELLTLLQADLNLLYPDSTRLAQLDHLINAALQLIAREGVTLQAPFSAEDGQLVVMYAAYLFRKRATGEAMPRMLRWALNNRILSSKAQGVNNSAT